MEKQILITINQRDRAFMSEFCVGGEFLTADGSKAVLLCRQVNAGEILEFMHRWDAVMLANLHNKNKYAGVELQ